MVDQNIVTQSTATLARKTTSMQQQESMRAERSQEEGYYSGENSLNDSNKFFQRAAIKDKKLQNIGEISVLSQNSDDGDNMLISTGVDEVRQRLVAREVNMLKRESDRGTAKQIKSLRMDLERKEEQMIIMQRKMNSLVKSKVDLLEELEVIKAKTSYEQAKLQKEIQQLKGDNISVQQQQAKDEEFMQLKQQNQNLQNQIQQLQNQNNLLMVELDAANEQQNDQNEIMMLKDQVKQLQNENQILMVELDAANEQENSNNQYNNKQEQQVFVQETPSCEGEQDNLPKVVELQEELKSERETCVELREQLVEVRQSLTSKVDNLEMQLQLLKMKYGQAQARLMDMDNQKGVSAISRSAPCSPSDNTPSLKHIEDLQAAEIKVVEAEKRAQQLAQELSGKTEELSASQKNLTSLRSNLLSMNNQVVQLSSQVKELQSRVKAKSGQLEIAQQHATSTQKLLESQRSQCQAYKLQSISLLGYFGAKVVQLENEKVVKDDDCDEISLDNMPQVVSNDDVLQSYSECASQSSHFKLKVYQQQQQASYSKNLYSSRNSSRNNNRRLSSSECVQCAECGHILATDVSVADNRLSSDHLNDSCQPISPQCSSYQHPLVSTISNSNSHLYHAEDTAQSPRRPIPQKEEIEQTDNEPPLIKNVSRSFISVRSRAVLKLILGKQPWIVWIRRLLLLSAAVFVRRNAQWFLEKLAL